MMQMLVLWFVALLVPGFAFALIGLSRVATRRSNTRALGLFDGNKDKKGAPTGSAIEMDTEVVDGVTIINKEKGVVGDTSVEFRQGDNLTMIKAFAGAPISEVAATADVFIKYKCKKGECGTCSIMVDGKWIQACQTHVPSMPKGEAYGVLCREVNTKSKKSSGFFSPQSFVDGVVNNGLGIVGFVKEGAQAGDEFSVRMDREAKLAAIVARKKAEKEASDK